MRGSHFLLLSVLTGLTIAGQPAAWGDRETQADQPVNKVNFDLYRDYLMVVRGSAGPFKNLNLLLDTGTSPSVLDARLAEKLHLNILPIRIAVLNGNVQGGVARAPNLQFGPIRRDNPPVLIEDLSFLQKTLPVRIDAIVGLDLLGQSTFVIDYASREIRFGPLPSMPGSIPLQMKEGLAIVDAEVNHAPVHLLVDTGSSSLILFNEGKPASVTSVEAGAVQPSSQAIGEFDRKQVRLLSLRLGEVEFTRKPAFVVHSPRDAGHDFDGVVSPAALGITRVAVDLGRGRLAFMRRP